MANEKFKVKFGLAVGDTSATIDATTGDIVTAGDIQLGGNTIKKSGGTPVIEFSGTNLTTLAGDLEVDGNSILSSTGATAIELSGSDIITGDITLNGGDIRSNGGTVAVSVNGADATVAGDLTVTGNDIKSSTGATAITMTGADVAVAGDLTVTGNDIKSSTGATAITMTGADVAVAGDLTVTGNDIKSSSATAITLTGADVTVAGDLTVTGNDIKSSSATAITLSGADVTVAGDLQVSGSDIKGPSGIQAIRLDSGNVTVAGTLEVDGNIIRSSAGVATLTMTTAGDVAVAGDLTVTGNDIKGITGITAITLIAPDIRGARDIIATRDFQTDSGVLTTGATTATLFNTTATTVNIAGAGTTVSIGANTGTTTINNSLVADDISIATVDTTNLEVTNIKAKDGTAAMTIADTTGAVNVSTQLTVDNININGNTIVSTDTNGNISLAPNGTGNVSYTFGNGGNILNNRNYVFGNLRNATTTANGDIWSLNQSINSTPARGVSLDNSADTTRTSMFVARNYGAGAPNRARLVFERSRGTAASPTAVAIGDLLGEVDATGYTGGGTPGWINDQYTFVPAFFGFTASENWVANTNVGSNFNLTLAPTATTVTSNAELITCIQINPQVGAVRADVLGMGQGKTAAFVATGCSISGTTLTIGTVTTGTVATGQLIQNAISTINPACYIVSGSGTTWTLNVAPGNQTGQTITGRVGFVSAVSGSTAILNNLRLQNNVINNSANQTQVTLSSDRSTLLLVGDTITMDTVSGTDMLVLNPVNAALRSNTITLEDSTGVDHLVIDSNKALFSRTVRTKITTGTVAKGGTYTPAVTALNSIIVEVTAGSGTTTIDVSNLTVAGENAVFDIMVFNNSGGSINANGFLITNGGNTVLDHGASIANGARAIFEVNCVDIYANAQFVGTAV